MNTNIIRAEIASKERIAKIFPLRAPAKKERTGTLPFKSWKFPTRGLNISSIA